MSAFRASLRAQLVAAAAGERPARRRMWRAPLLAAAAVAAVVAALVVANLDGGVGDERAATPPGERALAGRELFSGSLEPGVRYRTRRLVPAVSFVVTGDRWFANDTEQPQVLVLDRRRGMDVAGGERPANQAVFFASLSRVVDPSSGELVEPGADVLKWIRSHPDLRARTARETTLAGLPARVVDTDVRFDEPAQADPACAQRGGRCTLLVPGLAPPDDSQLRWIVVDTPRGPFAALVGGVGQRAFDGALEAASPIIASLRIAP